MILLIASCLFLQAQKSIVAAPSEYVAAKNYGGKVALKRFLQNEMNYPAKALANKTEGTVELSFVVDSKGTISRLSIKKSVSPEIDAEAIRLQKMLLFSPSFYRGKKVTTYSVLKIKFAIKTYKKYCKKRGYSSINLKDTTIDYSNIVYKDNEVTTKPYAIFDDSLETLSRFIYRNLKYPEGTLKLSITGTVKLFFVIEPTGRISNIKELRGVGGGATNEAERILQLTKWQPGTLNGKKVRVSKQFEVVFNLTNSSDFNYVPTQW